MIDTLLTLFNGAMTMVALVVVIWVAASILTAALSEPSTHDVTDDWERRTIGGGR